MNPEDYVSYPIALALKKAGFDEPCNYGYSVKMRLEPELSFGEPKMVHSKAPKNYNDNRKGMAKGFEFCSAVPLWQAQKWLREKRKIIVCPEPAFYMGRRPLMGYHYHIYDSSCYRTESPTVYDSYEEALSTGITAALELIEKKGE